MMLSAFRLPLTSHAALLCRLGRVPSWVISCRHVGALPLVATSLAPPAACWSAASFSARCEHSAGGGHGGRPDHVGISNFPVLEWSMFAFHCKLLSFGIIGEGASVVGAALLANPSLISLSKELGAWGDHARPDLFARCPNFLPMSLGRKSRCRFLSLFIGCWPAHADVRRRGTSCAPGDAEAIRCYGRLSPSGTLQGNGSDQPRSAQSGLTCRQWSVAAPADAPDDRLVLAHHPGKGQRSLFQPWSTRTR